MFLKDVFTFFWTAKVRQLLLLKNSIYLSIFEPKIFIIRRPKDESATNGGSATLLIVPDLLALSVTNHKDIVSFIKFILFYFDWFLVYIRTYDSTIIWYVFPRAVIVFTCFVKRGAVNNTRG